MQKLYDSYDNAWKQIIVPEKMDFYHDLGPEIQHNSKGELLKRLDFNVKNRVGEKIKGFIILNQTVPQDQHPCLVYLHSHSGSKSESLQISSFFLDLFNVCSFDFSGYGESEGQYSTLGLKEHFDLKAVVDYLRESLDIEDIYLWGRSMGAVTSILFAHHHYHDIEVQGMVLDSPFTEAKTMICDIVATNSKMPRFLIKGALIPISNTIRSKTKYDVLSNNPIEIVSKVRTPTYIFVGKDDKVTKPDRVKQMFDKLGSGVKHFEVIDGEHNSYREDETVINAMKWLVDLVKKRLALKKLMRESAIGKSLDDHLRPGELTLKDKEAGLAEDANSDSDYHKPSSPLESTSFTTTSQDFKLSNLFGEGPIPDKKVAETTEGLKLSQEIQEDEIEPLNQDTKEPTIDNQTKEPSIDIQDIERESMAEKKIKDMKQELETALEKERLLENSED